jgi:carbon storage regulator
MLIVTRRKGQRIVLGNDIEIVITDISRSGVKIGVIAPTSLTILRGEVRDAVEQANRDAASGDFADPAARAVPEAAAAPAVAETYAPLAPSAGEHELQSGR